MTQEPRICTLRGTHPYYKTATGIHAEANTARVKPCLSRVSYHIRRIAFASIRGHRVTNVADKSEFRLSRVYAEGWNAARQIHLEEGKTVLNPYLTEPERTRWSEGFAKVAD